MDEAKKEAAASAAAAASTTATNKKKRASSRPPQGDGNNKATKKKKKEEATTKKKKPPMGSTSAAANLASKPLVDQVLYRLTEGVPRVELKAMVREADDCEKNLLMEIRQLEEALKREKMNKPAGGDEASASEDKTGGEKSKDDKKDPPKSAAKESDGTPKAGEVAKPTPEEQFDKQIDTILENPFTPMDRCITLSALLGRLRDDLAVPSIRKPDPAIVAAANTNKKKKSNTNPAPTYPQLVALADNPNYTRLHPENTQLLHVWRKIASHRTAMVFRRPVKPEEAPGYTERILFPMDLSLVRKMIVARILTSYSQVHQRVRLISHNCVKYNGRESDYGVVAREFEACVDEYITAAVLQQGAAPATTGNAPTTSGRVSPKNVAGGGRSSPSTGRSSPGSGRTSPTNPAGVPAAPSVAAIAAATAAAAAAVANPQPAAASKTK